ncbi:MAG: hypothetical protein DRP51_00640 [Candidatus Zixiibacteriota bacterium]|nr:MAG: hypothetical protein DRP51_00640 [candidate division Zixibacteria bacterium]HHI02592.1 hypothetical protein [candidate division Zixibacteria bacterium]
MKKVIIIGVLALALILGCSRPGNNPVNSEEIWWGSPDPEATWIELPDYCSYRVPATQEAADSVCQDRGYLRSSGYEQDNCYVGGEKQVVLSCVACSVN